MKIVLDTNVLLSGLAFPNSTPGRILAAWDLHSFELAVSRYQLREIARVLAYPKIRRLLDWNEAQIEEFVQQLYLRVEVVEVASVSVDVPADPNDRPILATLITVQADVLVTGDSDLLALRDRYPIETPAEFVRRL